MPGGVSVSGGQVRTPAGAAPIVPLLVLGLGGYLMWFGVKYWRSSAQVWPSGPVKSVLQGRGLPATTAATTADVKLIAYETQVASGIAASESGQPAAAGGAGGGAVAGQQASGSAQNMARMLLGGLGWDAGQMPPLISLWTRESGWSATARNRQSGAFGVAQALGHGTGCSAAPDGTNEYGPQYGLTCAQAQQANAGSVLQQIRWGLGYIKDRYGSPSAAWAHEQAAGWY